MYSLLGHVPLVAQENLQSSNFRKMAYLSKEAVLNSDGTNIFNMLQKEIKIKNDKVIYTENNHRLKYIHIIIGNIKNNIGGIYHGVDKSVQPLYLWDYHALLFNPKF